MAKQYSRYGECVISDSATLTLADNTETIAPFDTVSSGDYTITESKVSIGKAGLHAVSGYLKLSGDGGDTALKTTITVKSGSTALHTAVVDTTGAEAIVQFAFQRRLTTSDTIGVYVTCDGNANAKAFNHSAAGSRLGVFYIGA